MARTLREISTTSDALTEEEKGLRYAPTKSDATRTMAVPAFLKDMLGEHLAQSSTYGIGLEVPVFATARGNLVRHGLVYRRVFRPAVREALDPRLHGLRWHDLRHTCARLSLAVEPSLHIVKERLGHTDIRTTINIYSHLLPEVDIALAAGLDAAFRSEATY